MTNYTPIITLVTLMKGKSNVYSGLHKLHTIRLPDEWHLRLCRYGHTKVVKDSQIGPGLADKGPRSLVLHRHYLIPHDSTEAATRSALSRTTTYFKRPHYCTQSALFIPQSLLRLWYRCPPTPKSSTKKVTDAFSFSNLTLTTFQFS